MSYGYLNSTFDGTSEYAKTYEFYIYWQVLSQDKKKVTSQIYLSYGLRKVASNPISYNTSGSAKLTATYEDQTLKDGSVYFDLREYVVGTQRTLYNKTFTVQHDENGRCTFRVSAVFHSGISLGSTQLSGEITLPTIPQESTISATDAYIGSTSVVTVGHSYDTYTHSIAVSFGEISGWLNDTGEIVDEEFVMSALSVPFTLPVSFYAEIPNDPSGIVTLVCKTYDGLTQIGKEQTATFIASAYPKDASPQITLSVRDVDQTAVSLSGGMAYIKNLSDLECVLTTNPRYGASIVSRTIGDVPIQEDGTVIFEDIQHPDVTAYVKDSRGLETTSYHSGNVFIDYFAPNVTANGKREEQSNNNVVLNVTGKFYCGYFGTNDATSTHNSLTVSYRARQINGEWSEYKTLRQYESSHNSNDYSFSATVGDIDYRYTWEIEIKAEDKAKTATYTITIPKGVPLYDWGENDFRFNVPVTFRDDNVRDQTRENLGIVMDFSWKLIGSWRHNGSLSADFTQYKELMFLYDSYNDSYDGAVSFVVPTNILTSVYAYLGIMYSTNVRFTVKLNDSNASTYAATYGGSNNTNYRIECYGR